MLDNGTLTVHHVIILQEVLTDTEVVFLNLALGTLDALAIIGTERHESRRVDRQLRGRAGRQGDPGSSVFYVSLEDKLMRLFASERIAKVMDRLGFEDGSHVVLYR